ncbi:UNVERIFIED_CONTAM: hypothetical protein FKN15_013329 [Acipenser sinensis]
MRPIAWRSQVRIQAADRDREFLGGSAQLAECRPGREGLGRQGNPQFTTHQRPLWLIGHLWDWSGAVRSVLSSGTMGLVASLWIRSAKNDGLAGTCFGGRVFQPPFPESLRGCSVHYDHSYGYLDPYAKGPDTRYQTEYSTSMMYYYDDGTGVQMYTVEETLLKEYIKKQIEYYFSLQNLERDFFLRRKMDDDGFLPISLIASFHRVQALTTDIDLIFKALKDSTEVEIIDHKIRRKVNPELWPIPGPAPRDAPRTDFSQLINCPEFIPRQAFTTQTTESAPSSPRASIISPKKNQEPNNLQTMSKGLSTSLPDLESEPWVEVKKRHRPSPVKPKDVDNDLLSSGLTCPKANLESLFTAVEYSGVHSWTLSSLVKTREVFLIARIQDLTIVTAINKTND